jgi:hypothetical protein
MRNKGETNIPNNTNGKRKHFKIHQHHFQQDPNMERYQSQYHTETKGAGNIGNKSEYDQQSDQNRHTVQAKRSCTCSMPCECGKNYAEEHETWFKFEPAIIGRTQQREKNQSLTCKSTLEQE